MTCSYAENETVIHLLLLYVYTIALIYRPCFWFPASVDNVNDEYEDEEYPLGEGHSNGVSVERVGTVRIA